MGHNWIPFFNGLGTGYGLIIAIGAQNVFVLSQGVRNHCPWLVALTCSAVDAALIVVGVAGAGAIIGTSPLLLAVATWGGALFLAGYGWLALRRALRPQALRPTTDTPPRGGWPGVLAATLAVSLLNPHVYLDTVVLLGSLGGRYPPAGKVWFTGGATLASLSWFVALSLAARRLAPVLSQPAVWRWLDVAIGVTLWVIAVALIR